MAQIHAYMPRVVRDVLMSRLAIAEIAVDFTPNTAYLNITNGAKFDMLQALDKIIVDDPEHTGITKNGKYLYTKESVIKWLDALVVKYAPAKFVSMENIRISLQNPLGD